MLVLGETGCGKEVVVNLIQQLSKRESGPFVKLNCGAIPETLIDDEFFGHEKGAFTDAKIQKKGVFERACGGTLFLDEIGELSLAAQVRLLRVLQQKVVTRIGGVQSIPVDFRLVAATHRDLKEMVQEGRFRNDLLYRLNLFP
ncbi:sigma-54 factor interaction domain-containing protein, partial [Parasutterella excrementihominis]